MTVNASNDALTYKGSDGSQKEAQGMFIPGTNMGAPVCLGEYVLAVDTSNTSNDLAALLGGGTVLSDAIAGTVSGLAGKKLSFILATVETNDVRASFKNNDPTTNGLLYSKANAKPYCWDPSDFTLMRLVGQGGTASVKVALFA